MTNETARPQVMTDLILSSLPRTGNTMLVCGMAVRDPARTPRRASTLVRGGVRVVIRNEVDVERGVWQGGT